MKVKEIIKQNERNYEDVMEALEHPQKVDFDIGLQRWKNYWDFLDTEFDRI